MDNFSLNAPNTSDLYETLGIQNNSSQEIVTEGFRNIAQLFLAGQKLEQQHGEQPMKETRFLQACEAFLVLRDGTQGDKLLDFDSYKRALISGGNSAIKGEALLNVFYKYVKTVSPKLQAQSFSPRDTSLKGSLYKNQIEDDNISDKDIESDSGSENNEDEEETNEKTDSGDDKKPQDAQKKDNEFRSEDFVNFANMDPFSSMLGVSIDQDSNDDKKFKSLEKFASKSVTFISDDQVKCNLCEDVIAQDELVGHLEEDHDEEFKTFKKDEKQKAQTKKSMLSFGK